MSYKNFPSEQFVSFFNKKIEKKETSHKEIAEKFGKYQGNPTLLLSNIENGKHGVTVELILLAQEHFGLDPASLFDRKQNLVEKNAEESTAYVSVKKYQGLETRVLSLQSLLLRVATGEKFPTQEQALQALDTADLKAVGAHITDNIHFGHS